MLKGHAHKTGPALIQKKGRPSIVQPKLAINAPGDVYERQADEMAAKVVSTKATHQHYSEQLNKPVVQTKSAAAEGGYYASGDFISQLNNSKGSGVPLPAGTQGFMENAFSADFSRVRVHDNDNANTMSRGINARAFTHGSDIYFRKGEYNPGTKTGQKIIAHELTHVLQQLYATKNNIQRDLLAYNVEHSDTIPSLAIGTGSSSMVYAASNKDLSVALDSLVKAGKIIVQSSGDAVIYRSSGATLSEVEAAFKSAGFSQAADMAKGLMDAHNIFIYSKERLMRASTVFTTHEFDRKEVTEKKLTRPLTSLEMDEAKKVFAGSINLSAVKLHEDPVMGVGGYARTTPGNINFPPGSFGSPGFMSWLIHELTHIWQYQHGVWLSTTIYYAVKAEYNYGGEAGLKTAYASRKSFRSFNTEQQGDIVQDYYDRSRSGLDVTAWLPYITELQTGKLP